MHRYKEAKFQEIKNAMNFYAFSTKHHGLFLLNKISWTYILLCYKIPSVNIPLKFQSRALNVTLWWPKWPYFHPLSSVNWTAWTRFDLRNIFNNTIIILFLLFLHSSSNSNHPKSYHNSYLIMILISWILIFWS